MVGRRRIFDGCEGWLKTGEFGRLKLAISGDHLAGLAISGQPSQDTVSVSSPNDGLIWVFTVA
jgi:hypothetical protein